MTQIISVVIRVLSAPLCGVICSCRATAPGRRLPPIPVFWASPILEKTDTQARVGQRRFTQLRHTTLTWK